MPSKIGILTFAVTPHRQRLEKQRKQRVDEEELLDESVRLAEKYGMLDCGGSKLAKFAFLESKMKSMKFWKLMIALAAACFAGGLWQTTAQETLTIEYTLEGVEGVRHELQVDADEKVLKFENIPLTSLTLPEGLTRLSVLKVDFGFRGGNMTNLTLPEGLRSLEILGLWRCGLTNLTLPKGLVQMRDLRIATRYDTPLTSLKLPEDFGKNVKYPFRIGLQLASSIERLSMHKNMREFWLRKSGEELEELDFPSARELIRNRKPDS